MRNLDVVVLGGGLAGLTAAYHLRDLDLDVLDAAAHVGGRTKSIRQPDGIWLNQGALYLSSDRVRAVELAEAVGARLIPDPSMGEYWRGLYPPDPEARGEIESCIERIVEEQARRRPPTLPELDDQPFDQWLGKVSEATRSFFDRWCQIMNAGSSVEVSLYGALWLWGDQRSTPWTDRPVPRHDRGDAIFDGGTNEFTKAIAHAIGDRVSLRSRVLQVAAEGDGYRVEFEDETGRRALRSRRVICALPAPVAGTVIGDLPGWKLRAMAAVRYGRFLTTSIVVAPADAPPAEYPLTASRTGVAYNLDGFVIRTPGDLDEWGGCFHNFVGDPTARVIWDDPDHTITTGALRALFARLPEYRGRVRRVEVQRWEHGMPLYTVGRMKAYHLLGEPVGSIHFCGDYTWASNMEGAVLSGERAANQVRSAIGG